MTEDRSGPPMGDRDLDALLRASAPRTAASDALKKRMYADFDAVASQQTESPRTAQRWTDGVRHAVEAMLASIVRPARALAGAAAAGFAFAGFMLGASTAPQLATNSVAPEEDEAAVFANAAIDAVFFDDDVYETDAGTLWIVD